MDDFISRSAAIDALTNMNLKRNFDSVCDGDINRTRRAAQRVIAQLPAIDVAPVVHGRWVKMTGMMPPEYHGHYECSECQWHMKGLRNSWTREEELSYCPNCGAKMDDVNINE